jgi:argininosuccinate lyase
LTSVRVMNLVIEKLGIDEKRLAGAFPPEIYATDLALELVGRGEPFRDAYRRVGNNLQALEGRDPYRAIRERSYSGTTGNLGLERTAREVGSRRERLAERARESESRIESLAGFKVPLYD